MTGGVAGSAAFAAIIEKLYEAKRMLDELADAADDVRSLAPGGCPSLYELEDKFHDDDAIDALGYGSSAIDRAIDKLESIDGDELLERATVNLPTSCLTAPATILAALGSNLATSESNLATPSEPAADSAHSKRLTREQKRELIQQMISADSQKSDRAIGAAAGAHHSTVSAVRKTMNLATDAAI
jgi:lysophospholipase L1-like esterase